MSAPVVANGSEAKPPHRGLRRRWPWILAALIVVGFPAFYAVVFYLYWPFKKQDLIDVLQQRSLRSITIDGFHTSYFPPGCVAEGIKFLHVKHKGEPPLITIGKLVATTNYGSLIRFQRRLDNVRVIGLHVRVPAREPSNDPSPIMPLTYGNSKTSMPIANLYADDAVLDFYRSGSPNPFGIHIEKLAIHNIRPDTPFTYQVRLHTSEPPGIIESSGTFGPWNPKRPGQTSAHGTFTYHNANLAFFKQVSGSLSSHGLFTGNLAGLRVSGTANVPDFTLHGTSHKRPLDVSYDTRVDAIDGSVNLTRVVGAFNHTVLQVQGAIDGNGQTLVADIASGQARLEDLIDLFIAAKRPPMTGAVSFEMHVRVPFNGKPFLQALALNGEFGIARGQFRDQQLEQGLAKLSHSTKQGKETEPENSATVLSHLKGQVSAANGVAHLSHVEFMIPGAHAWINGTYSLLNYRTNLLGTLITQGDVSKTETGFKSILLKTLTPFFRRKHHAKIVPFKITGTYGHTNISLALGGHRPRPH